VSVAATIFQAKKKLKTGMRILTCTNFMIFVVVLKDIRRICFDSIQFLDGKNCYKKLYPDSLKIIRQKG